MCMRLLDLVTLVLKSSMLMAAVFWDIENAFDTTWHSGLLYIFSELEFLTRLIKLICFFLTSRFKVFVEGMSRFGP
jgi:hypothetical protein